MEDGTQTTTETKNNSSIRMVAILAIILVILLGSWYYFNNSETNNTNGDAQPTPTVTPTPNEEQTSTETYSNDIFAFNYPENASLDEQPDMVRLVHVGEKQTASGRTQTELADGYTFQVLTISNMNTDLKTLDEHVQSEINSAKEICPDEVITTKNITLNGHEGVQYSTMCRMPATYTYFEHHGEVYLVLQTYTSYPNEDEDLEMYKEATNQIYNSFKFL